MATSSTMSMSLRTLLRAPSALRPLLLQQQQHAAYHSYEHPAPPLYPEPQYSILSSALRHVPQQGFTREALVSGARDQQYLDISAHNLFPKGPFELVKFYLAREREALKGKVQFVTPGSDRPSPSPATHPAGGEARRRREEDGLNTTQKLKSLILARLQSNIDSGILPHLPQALGYMSLAKNIPSSLRELGLLADEMWFLAGDVSVDSSWYTKRGALSGVYAAAEMFQMTRSKEQRREGKSLTAGDGKEVMRETEEFVERRLEDVRVVGSVVGGTMQWAGFQAGAVVNLLRSKGVRV